MSRLRILAAISMMWVAFPAVAGACAALLPEPAAHLRARQIQYLFRYSDLVVYGTWSEEPSTPANSNTQAGEYRLLEGWVTVENGTDRRRYHVSFREEINCGFPDFPSNGAIGLFYLRNSNPLSADDDGNDDALYDLLHFQGVRALQDAPDR